MLIADGAPTYVTITVTGPLRQLDRLTPDMFTALVDLSHYGPGSWELIPVIRNDSIARFPDVVIVSQASRIQVTLESPVVEEPEPEPEPEPATETDMEPTTEPTDSL